MVRAGTAMRVKYTYVELVVNSEHRRASYKYEVFTLLELLFQETTLVVRGVEGLTPST